MSYFIGFLESFRNIDLLDKLCWKKIGRVVIISWILFFVFEFIAVLGMWMSLPVLKEAWLIVSVLTVVFLITAVPGSIALIQQNIRRNLYTIPEAAALSAFTLSFILSFGLLFSIALSLYLMDGSSTCWNPPCTFFTGVLEPILAGLFVGIFAFPVTMGLAFPFGICAGCALVIWIVIDEAGFISKKRWNTYVGVSVFGWILVVLIGYVLGHA